MKKLLHFLVAALLAPAAFGAANDLSIGQRAPDDSTTLQRITAVPATPTFGIVIFNGLSVRPGVVVPNSTLVLNSTTLSVNTSTLPAGATGAQGPQGAQGIQGIQGIQGATGAAGPQGETGAAGAAGPAPTISLGALNTGTTAAVNITGTAPNYTLSFTVVNGTPGAQGEPGQAGEPGAQGPAGPAGPTGTTGAMGPTGTTGLTGATGATGTAATISIGTVTTGAAGGAAAVANAGTSASAVFTFSIPRGATGSTGLTGASGPTNTLSIGTVGTTTGAPAASITGVAPSQALNLTLTAAPTRVFSTVTRALNSNYTVSSTRDALVSYSINASWNLAALLSGTGSAFLEYSLDAGSTWVTVNQVSKTLNLLTVAGGDDMNLTGAVPAGSLVRLRTTATNMTVSYVRGQEVLL